MNNSLLLRRESPDDSQLESLLTEQEYAQIAKRSLASIRRDRLIRQCFPYVKLGALVRYRPSDVRAYFESHLHKPAREASGSGASNE